MHRIKEKGLDMTFIGTICTGACFAQESVRIHDASRCCPQALLQWPSSPTQIFVRQRPTCDDDLLNEFKQDFDLTIQFKS
jgi:hypothetical protein